MLTFLLVVFLPTLASTAYLWTIARDQYGSTLAFSVRQEEFQPNLGILGGLGQLQGTAASETELLYEFIRSQELVRRIDARIDLRRVWGGAWPDDPVFAFNPSGTIEDLQQHWRRAVRVTYDAASGLMSLRVLAFAPADAQAIASAILEESTQKINALAAEAHEDATRFARAELERSVERLKAARAATTGFRLRTRIVDPQADLQGQMGLLHSLQAQLAQSLIELDILRQTARDGDPRILLADRRVEVIENRIAIERRKFGEGGQGPGGEDFATLMAEYEALTVDREFAEQSYRAALASYDLALAEAQRQSRYLAAHVTPTRAERSEHPRRGTLAALAAFFLLTAWSIGVLIYYSIRDRR